MSISVDSVAGVYFSSAAQRDADSRLSAQRPAAKDVREAPGSRGGVDGAAVPRHPKSAPHTHTHTASILSHAIQHNTSRPDTTLSAQSVQPREISEPRNASPVKNK